MECEYLFWPWCERFGHKKLSLQILYFRFDFSFHLRCEKPLDDKIYTAVTSVKLGNQQPVSLAYHGLEAWENR